MDANTAQSSDWMKGPDDQDQPSLYHSPSQVFSQSRELSSFTVTSPLSDLADKINPFTGYAPVIFDQNWQSTRFYPKDGSYPEQVPENGLSSLRGNASSVDGGYAGQDIDLKPWDNGNQYGRGPWGLPVQNFMAAGDVMANGSEMPSEFIASFLVNQWFDLVSFQEPSILTQRQAHMVCRRESILLRPLRHHNSRP